MTFEEKYRQNNEAIDTIKNGSETIGVKYGDETPTPPTSTQDTTPSITNPTTQPKKLELNNNERSELFNYFKTHNLPFYANERLDFQNHLEKRKYEYLKDFYRPKDWELEFKNFLKTPPSSQVLDDRPAKLPLSPDENRVVNKLLINGTIPNYCFADFRNELEKTKAIFYTNHKVLEWNKTFMHHTLQNRSNLDQNTTKKENHDNFCKPHNQDNISLKF